MLRLRHAEGMPRRIDFAEASAVLCSRSDLTARGLTTRGIDGRIRRGEIVRVHRGAHVDGAIWNDLWPEGKHLLRVLAVQHATARPPVFVGISAAVIWGLPLFRVADVLVHVAIEGERHSRVAAGVARHRMKIADAEITVRHGLRCTTLSRTVADLARMLPSEAAVCAGDAALRLVAARGHDYDKELAAVWKSCLTSHLRRGQRGIRRAYEVCDFLDGRAQLPGESVSRLQLRRLGFAPPLLQVPVIGAEGREYRLDFGFRRSRVFGEFDGEAKYLEPQLRSRDTPAEALIAEKWREDDVRGVTGWSFARWGHMHIGTPDRLGRRLAAFGVHPPG